MEGSLDGEMRALAEASRGNEEFILDVPFSDEEVEHARSAQVEEENGWGARWVNG